MQIMIDIPNEDISNKQEITDINIHFIDGEVCECNYGFQLLPKGHGKLIDADEVVKEICIEYKVNSIYELPDELRSFINKYLNEAPTILEPTIEYMIKNYAFSKREK